LEVRHVQLTNQLQQQLDGIFQAQEAIFNAGINSEIPFTGDWKPDDDELLVINGLPEAQILLNAAAQNAIALPPLDVANFSGESIKALFTSVGNGAAKRLLLQNFGPQQMLTSQLSFLHDGNTFRRLTEPAFSLGTQLVATVTNAGDLKFKSYAMLRRIMDISPVFRQATDIELAAFCGHASLSVQDTQGFVATSDEGLRKLVFMVNKVNVLGNHSVAQIQNMAAAIGFQINIVGNQIEVPQDRKNAKALCSFLLNKVYRGPIDQKLFITNSNRPLA
jgi:hypothetical protein